jgi:glycosyltransferase involved in cell wall biosynthesis
MKGFDVVQALIRLFPNIFWVIVLRGEKQCLVFDAPNVHVIHNAPHASLAVVYAAADFSVCPSAYEPFGYVVAEALLCGTPVVAAPGGASSMFLSEPPMDRLLVPREKGVTEFATVIREVLDHREYYRQLVLEKIQPKVLQWMEPHNWWNRFFHLTGIPGPTGSASVDVGVAHAPARRNNEP